MSKILGAYKFVKDLLGIYFSKNETSNINKREDFSLKNFPKDIGDIYSFINSNSTNSDIVLKGLVQGIEEGHIGVMEHAQYVYNNNIDKKFKIQPDEWIDGYSVALETIRGTFADKGTSLGELTDKLNSQEVQDYINHLKSSKDYHLLGLESVLERINTGIVLSDIHLTINGLHEGEKYFKKKAKEIQSEEEFNKEIEKYTQKVKTNEAVKYYILNNGIPNDNNIDLTKPTTEFGVFSYIDKAFSNFDLLAKEGLKYCILNNGISKSDDIDLLKPSRRFIREKLIAQGKEYYSQLNQEQKNEINDLFLEKLYEKEIIRHYKAREPYHKPLDLPTLTTDEEIDLNMQLICKYLNFPKNDIVKYNPRSNLEFDEELRAFKDGKQVNYNIQANGELINILQKNSSKKLKEYNNRKMQEAFKDLKTQIYATTK